MKQKCDTLTIVKNHYELTMILVEAARIIPPKTHTLSLMNHPPSHEHNSMAKVSLQLLKESHSI